jgi:hypothetical protein
MKREYPLVEKILASEKEKPETSFPLVEKILAGDLEEGTGGWADQELFSVNKTYDIVTHESASRGDYEETGFEWQDKKMSFNDIQDEIKNHLGYYENLQPNSSHGQSLYGVDPDTDYKTGEETRYAIHIKGAPEDMLKLSNMLKGR